MYGPLALIIVAAGVFLGLIVRNDPSAYGERNEAADQVRGFVLVGAGAMIALGGAVMIIGILAPPNGTAESIGLLALFGFVLYLLVSGTVVTITRISASRRWRPPAPGSAPAEQPRYGDPGRDGTGHPADHRRGDQP